MDRVRVLRIVEYEGPREWVERTVSQSLHGTCLIGTRSDGPCIIRGATVNEFPILIEGYEWKGHKDPSIAKKERHNA